MRKTIAIITGAVLAIGLFTGCGTNGNRAQQPSQQQQSQQDIQPTQAQIPQGTVDTSKFIGEERAKQIALERAGLTADGVIFDRVELDNDDGVWQYEVEFKKNFVEYDADINATDGTIRSWDVDRD